MHITQHIKVLDEFHKLIQLIRTGRMPCSAFGVPESLKPHIARAVAEATQRPVIVVCASQDKAETYAEATPGGVFIPKRALQLRASVARSRELTFARITGISRMRAGKAAVAYLSEEALAARMVPPGDFERAQTVAATGDVIDPEQMMQRLVTAGYERVGAVEAQGQAARRGEIVDVFCPGQQVPIRIDFFDDVVESIHEFDPGTQRRSKQKIQEVTLLPAIEMILSDETAQMCAAYFEDTQPETPSMAARFDEYARLTRKDHFFEDIENFAYAFCNDSLIDYLPGALIVFDDYKHIRTDGQDWQEMFALKLRALVKSGEAVDDQRALYLPQDEIKRRALGRDVLDFCVLNASGELGAKSEISVHAKGALSYNKKLDLLKDDLKARVQNGWRVYLMCGSKEKAEKLSQTLSDGQGSIPFIADGRELVHGQAGTYTDRLLSGFELTTIKTYFLGEHEIYGFVKRKKKAKRRKALDVFTDLKTGDMIVHDVHGKGKFLGLVTRAVQGISRDYLELEYRGGDKLFIPTDQIDRVQKYMGGESERLSKLGGKEWSQTKARVKKAVKELAEDLVSIYSERIGSKGHKYGEDTLWQRQFEDNFPFEETEGQLKSTCEIKADMQSDKVMDRLLLGDVGYGKTEVAMRACFKAVMEGRQCAVLVPTTLLARQHHHTFTERFTEFAVEIESLSRFVPAGEQRRVIAGLAAGTVDVVIGTHRLLSRDVVFKDLGLLIIDEEQRFGVSHKERIKDLKRNVDVLTLSATPIPRTLQMSLTGIRDMSMLDTPPEERKPPESYVLEYSGQLVRDAVVREMERGGQTYFVCRQIAQMDKLAGDLRQFVPEARVAAAHGRMSETQIENVMVDFDAGEYDVLLCTTIIESGIDIPNVNTVIVYEAHMFGLAQLYQIKGRVGRATQNAYAYLTYLPGTRMTPEAEKRLQTIAEFTEFGAGFKIAMRDLEIRGAGNMLGPEQSGQMAAVGYDMYCRMMREAVAEVRGKTPEQINESSVEIKIDAHVPGSYISNEMQRIEVYKKIAAVDGTRSARQVREEIADRYGKLPKPVENLIVIAVIRHFAMRAGIASITRVGRVFTLKYGAESRLNTNKLLKILDQHKGIAQLRAAVPPFILLKTKDKPLDTLLGFLKEISRCVLQGTQV